jgi:tetrahydromethanopterin S-methyltransferase subunit B
MIEEVKAILSGWDNVRVEDNGAYWLVAGSYQGQAHAGTRVDPVSLAHDLAKLAGSWVEPPVDAYEAHWEAVTAGKLVDAVPFVDPIMAENDALRARIAELEAAAAPVVSSEPPAEALLEAYPDEDHASLKARIMAEFASLRNMLIGSIPMTPEQLNRLVALEHPKYQSWLQGVTK